jgi:hypothetical protein
VPLHYWETDSYLSEQHEYSPDQPPVSEGSYFDVYRYGKFLADADCSIILLPVHHDVAAMDWSVYFD